VSTVPNGMAAAGVAAEAAAGVKAASHCWTPMGSRCPRPRAVTSRSLRRLPVILSRLTREAVSWGLDAYRAALRLLPLAAQEAVAAAWGDPAQDPACRDGAFRFAGADVAFHQQRHGLFAVRV